MEASGRYEPATIRARHKHLQTILAAKSGASAQRDKLIRLNPCEGVDLPDVYDKEVDVFAGAEVKALIRAMPVWGSR